MGDEGVGIVEPEVVKAPEMRKLPKMDVVPEVHRQSVLRIHQLKSAMQELKVSLAVSKLLIEREMEATEKEIRKMEFTTYPKLGWDVENLPAINPKTWEYSYPEK
jgi:hypothetical protein